MATARDQKRQIKGISRAQKEALINAHNQSWSELSDPVLGFNLRQLILPAIMDDISGAGNICCRIA
jgi:hypothetical protein